MKRNSEDPGSRIQDPGKLQILTSKSQKNPNLQIRNFRFGAAPWHRIDRSEHISKRRQAGTWILDLGSWGFFRPWVCCLALVPCALAKELVEANAQPSVTNEIQWSLKPITRPAVPSIANAKWKARTPIDNFIFAKLAEAKLSPSPEASRRTLIRRLYFDLIGLPPTPAEARAFENDKSPDAYTKLVERLLASPQYGERWARHWLSPRQITTR